MGTVSLENNGGFSSIRHRFSKTEVNENTKLSIRLKGDGKRYQLRVKANARLYFSYITYIGTSGEWQTVEIDLADMYPSFRGMLLNQPNFAHDTIEEIGFLISNKKAENFQLLIDKIELK